MEMTPDEQAAFAVLAARFGTLPTRDLLAELKRLVQQDHVRADRELSFVINVVASRLEMVEDWIELISRS